MPSPYQKVVHATWKTPFSVGLWKKLEGLKATSNKTSDVFAFGPTLPDGEDPRIAEAVVHHHGDEDELHWAMTVQSAPEDEPPQFILEHDRSLGGRRGLASLLAEGFAPGAPTIGAFRVRLNFPETNFRCALIPTRLEKGAGHDAALLLGRDVRLEQVGYRFEGGGAGGIEEVTLVYLHRDGKFSATTAATGPLKLKSSTWLPFADDICDLVQNTFFVPSEVIP